MNFYPGAASVGNSGCFPRTAAPRRHGLILYVCTEALSHLDEGRRAVYERARRRLETIAGEPCELRHYLDVTGFSGCSAVVLSGSNAPWAAHGEGAFQRLGEAVAEAPAPVPVLGICAGMQLLAEFAGGRVEPLGRLREGEQAVDPEFQGELEAVIGYRPIELLVPDDPLFAGLEARPEVWKYHTHEVSELPAGFEALAAGGRCRYEVIRRRDAPVWGTQFHPEEADALRPAGERMLANFFASR